MKRQKKQLAVSLERWAFPRWGLVVLLLLGIGTGLSVYGQAGRQIKVSGTIVDENNEPLIGVTLMVKGASAGTVTNLDGNYTIQAPENGTLVVSYIGYENQEIKVNKRSKIDVKMKPSAVALDEVVVTGYGSIRRSDITGSVASVSAESISKVAATSVTDALMGKMPGVQITTADGALDAEVNIRVRGGGSITQDNSPLYIVDGFPVDNINNIPPTDIATVDVLKEASMTAIYGARGANGVVVITTKSPKAGKTSIQFNSYLQTRTLAKKLPLMDNYEFVMAEYEYQLVRNGESGVKDFNRNFGFYDDLDLYKYIEPNDWQEDIFGGTPLSQYYNLSIDGGSEKTKFNISFTRNKDEGQMIGSGLSRNNIRMRLNHELFKGLKLETNINYMNRTVDGAGTGGTNVKNALCFRPTNGLSNDFAYDYEDENLDEAGNSLEQGYTPSQDTEQNYRKKLENKLSLQAALVWDVVNHLQFRSEFGINNDYTEDRRFWGPKSSTARGAGMNNQPSAERTKSHSAGYRLANTLTYRNFFKRAHSVNLMIGQEINHSQSDNTLMSARYFPISITADAALENFALGTPNQSTSFKDTPVRTSSFFGRALYDYRNRYYATFTFRADGSTKFAPGKQWGYFPAGSLAWRISNESWMKPVKFISDLKLRASLGLAGNNRIGNDLWQNIYRVKSGNSAPAFNNGEYNYYEFGDVKYLYDPDLKWETTITRNLGLDFGFFNNRLTGTIDLYWNTTKDLLVPSKIPNSSGYSEQLTNVGQTSNKGIEIAMSGAIVKSKNFNLDLNFNVSFNKNKVDKLASGETEWKQKALGSDWYGTYNYKLEVGKTMGLIYGLVNDGMYTMDDFTFENNTWKLKPGIANASSFGSGGFSFKPGGVKFKKQAPVDPNNPDSYVVTEDDFTVIGNTNPKMIGGFGFSGNWKSIDFTAFFNFMYDFDVLNANKFYLASNLRHNNTNLSMDMSLANRYRYVNDEGVNVANDPTALAALNQNASIYSWHSMTQGIVMSDIVEDGSFLRLGTLTIGYTFPRRWLWKLKVDKLRVYVSGSNLFTLTGYSGYDPEVNVQKGLTPGVDYNVTPRSRTYTVGINLNF
ncbi:SusC/RagA family TonB-linked outer membrane protein [Bacteroides sp. RTP21281st1_E4_RTP21281_210402]|uniref:SusC/RagA family TonB-linked outer membrane protein n=1 Tax=unclassified Bacteroides TaxID=2646097 RepID=UPI0034A45E48